MEHVKWTIEVRLNWSDWWKLSSKGKKGFSYCFINPIKILMLTDDNLTSQTSFKSKILHNHAQDIKKIKDLIKYVNEEDYPCRMEGMLVKYKGNKPQCKFRIFNYKITLEGEDILEVKYQEIKEKQINKKKNGLFEEDEWEEFEVKKVKKLDKDW